MFGIILLSTKRQTDRQWHTRTRWKYNENLSGCEWVASSLVEMEFGFGFPNLISAREEVIQSSECECYRCLPGGDRVWIRISRKRSTHIQISFHIFMVGFVFHITLSLCCFVPGREAWGRVSDVSLFSGISDRAPSLIPLFYISSCSSAL